MINGIVPGKVYPYYGNISTFTPDSMTANQKVQEVWIDKVKTQRVELWMGVQCDLWALFIWARMEVLW